MKITEETLALLGAEKTAVVSKYGPPWILKSGGYDFLFTPHNEAKTIWVFTTPAGLQHGIITLNECFGAIAADRFVAWTKEG